MKLHASLNYYGKYSDALKCNSHAYVRNVQ